MKFTYPFCYIPSPEVVGASQDLIVRISSDPSLHTLFAEGKMLGVLLTDSGPLYAFSGVLSCGSTLHGFVPPVFDTTEGYFKKREREISSMSDPLEKREASKELQSWLFDQYKVCNARGEWLSIKEIFALRGLMPPGGTGDCAAPKLLQYAYTHHLKPLAMGEFWYGASPLSEIREQGRFYPSCTGKCGPLLSFMLQGLEVEDNPLDSVYTGTEPKILYCDDDIIVADKPSGMLSVPGRTRDGSLLSYLKERFGEVYSCHRLDMDTSGVMVFARGEEMQAAMQGQFAERKVDKYYRARLCSSSTPFRRSRKGTIALPLSLDYYDRPRQIVDRKTGKLAITQYEVLEFLPNGEVDVLFHPLTGRTHQLRVHAAHPEGLGRPIKGDRLYGCPDSGRLFLHAESIRFHHPRTGVELLFQSLPEQIF